MNEDKWKFTIDKLVPAEEIINNIEECHYIDAYLGYEDNFQIDSILYYLKTYQQLKEENERLQEQKDFWRKEFVDKKEQLDLYKEVIEEVREYITSYSSIHTIQFGTEEDSLNDIELNKTLDEKTITEMTNRYLKVHDKLLQILDKGVKDE